MQRVAAAASPEVTTAAAEGATEPAAADRPRPLDGPTAGAALDSEAALPVPQTKMPDAALAAAAITDDVVETATEGAVAVESAPHADAGAEATSDSRAADSTAEQSLGQDSHESHPIVAAAAPDEAGGEASEAAAAEANAGGTRGSRGAGDAQTAAAKGPAGALSVAEQRATGVQQARLRAEAAMAESVLAHVRLLELLDP